MGLNEFIRVADGREKADLLLKNAKIVNVFAGEIIEDHVAILKDRIVGFGIYSAHRTIDLEGKYICPGLIDGHVHIESSLLSVPEYARAVVPRGTSAVVADPHEIANVLGLDGIRYILDSSRNLPLDTYLMLPSCVPVSHLETTGAQLTASDLSLLINDARILGIGEVMNYPAVLQGDSGTMDKIAVAGQRSIDGHAPQLSGKQLSAYISAGIMSDHECTSVEEAEEKLRKGMHIMIREASPARNLTTLLPLVNSRNSRRFSFVSDDKHPIDLAEEGHIDYMIKTAVQMGVDPVMAIQMATLNTAEYFHLRNIGAIAPGYQADIVIFNKPHEFKVLKVVKRGTIVAENRQFITPLNTGEVHLRSSINVAALSIKDLNIKAEGKELRVIEVVPDQIVTKETIEKTALRNGLAITDVDQDLLKIVVIERHLASGNIGCGFVKGFGLKKGAIASSVAHDSHNIVVVGTNDQDMLYAVEEIIRMRGGLVAVADSKVLSSLSLEIAGLMSSEPFERVEQKMRDLASAAREMECRLERPFMTLSFMALPVIPDLKLTDKGLVDVNQFAIVPLFVR
ncbi:MAG: adenine deaminase [Candidatus Bathyarchaeota archaeon]|nr:adenine deaminase [Candidatus Bathyarchaeota archaeon]